MMIRELILLA